MDLFLLGLTLDNILKLFFVTYIADHWGIGYNAKLQH